MFCLAPAGAQQFIDLSEPVPFLCPVVCAGGSIVAKVFRIQGLQGSQLQAVLSSAQGSFATGAQTLPIAAYSTNNGSSYTSGPYTVSNNDVANLVVRVVVPAATAAGGNYQLKFRTTSYNGSANLLRCPGGPARILVAAPTPVVAPVPPTTQGIGQWVAHLYTWSPTTTTKLDNPTLVGQQDFFNSTNYKGHIIYDSLSLDQNFTATGGCPGIANNGSSLGCDNSIRENFALRLSRRQNFAPGLYTLSIQGDDGIRLSIDGGATFILSSFFEQPYAASLRTTASASPGGICLSGPVDLVLEFFQRPAESRLTFKATRLGQPILQPASVAVCTGLNTSFTVGNPVIGTRYQWQVSNDGGTTFVNLFDADLYTGAISSTLGVTGVLATMSGLQYRCRITNACGTAATNNATLTVNQAGQITAQPADVRLCNQPLGAFSVSAEGTNISYQWQVNTGNGFTDISGPDATTNRLPANSTLFPTGGTFRCVVTGTCGPITSGQARLILVAPTAITSQPTDQNACAGRVAFTVGATGSALAYTWQTSADTGKTWNPLATDGPYEGQTSASLSVAASPLLNGHQYRVLVQGDCSQGFFTSGTATLTVPAGVQITTQPRQTNCINAVTIGLAATGAGLNYLWYYSTDNGSTYNPVPATQPYGQNSTTALTINPVDRSQKGYLFKALVSGACSPGIYSETTTLALCIDTCKVAPLANIIVANGLAINREFFTYKTCDFSAFSMRVYNRWGRLVFTSTNAATIWNGTRGQEDGPGTYYYYLSYTTNLGTISNKGYVELVKE